MRQFLLQITIGQVGRSKSKSKSSVISTFVLTVKLHRYIGRSSKQCFDIQFSLTTNDLFKYFCFLLVFHRFVTHARNDIFLANFWSRIVGRNKKKKRKQVDSKVCNVLEKQIIGPFYWKCFKLELRNDFVSKKLLSINWANFHCLVIFISQKR